MKIFLLLIIGFILGYVVAPEVSNNGHHTFTVRMRGRKVVKHLTHINRAVKVQRGKHLESQFFFGADNNDFPFHTHPILSYKKFFNAFSPSQREPCLMPTPPPFPSFLV